MQVSPSATRWTSGGASPHAPPSLAARGFTRRRQQKQEVGQARLLSFFLSSPAVKTTVTCKTKQTPQTVGFILFFSFLFCFPFWSVSSFLAADPAMAGFGGRSWAVLAVVLWAMLREKTLLPDETEGRPRGRQRGGTAAGFGLRRRGGAAGLVLSAEEKNKSKEGGAPLLFSFGRVEKIRG